jgi:hypothetical protein
LRRPVSPSRRLRARFHAASEREPWASTEIVSTRSS